MDLAKTTAIGYKKRLSFGIWCDLYQRITVVISGINLRAIFLGDTKDI